METSGYSEEEKRKESSKAAQSSLQAKRKARRLIQAAAGAGDAEERQKLLQEALNKEIEAESFGKAAKYIQSGAFQGFMYGSLPGISLGVLTGTLVGGVTSLITGGLGAGIGALRGPTFKLGDLAGKGIRKITGDWGSWEATEEQKEALERMIWDVNEQDPPSDEELEALSNGTGAGAAEGLVGGTGNEKQSWTEYASSFMPSMVSSTSKQSQTPAGRDATNDRQQRSPSTSQKPGSPTQNDTASAIAAAQRSRPTNRSTKSTAKPSSASGRVGDTTLGPSKSKANTRRKPANAKSTKPQAQPNREQRGGRQTSTTDAANSRTTASCQPTRPSAADLQNVSSERRPSQQPSGPKKKPRKIEIRSRTAES